MAWFCNSFASVWRLSINSRMKRYFSIICIFVLALSSGVATNGVPEKSITHPLSLRSGAKSPPSAFAEATARQVGLAWETYTNPGLFGMSLARDGAGNVWAGTEGNGVWRFNPYAVTNQWQQFTTNDGLGDDFAYAVAVDKLGRIWAGHLNHGVSVYNGNRWTNYDIPFGPIGERIFKIAVCPVDGDVWLGTSAGLTRYSVSKDEWIHYTRNEEGRMKNEETGQVNKRKRKRKPPHPGPLPRQRRRGSGLPSDQISAIAFDAAGNIYVGTQCDGIAMASRDSDYREWKQARMADQKFPTFAGFGLPSNLINDLLVASDGTVYAATDSGLAWTGTAGKRGSSGMARILRTRSRGWRAGRRKAGRQPCQRMCRRKIM